MSRKPKGALVAWWCARERDIKFGWDKQRADGSLLYGVMCLPRWRPHICADGERAPYDKSFVEELEARGYDLSTLRFSVERKADASAPRGPQETP